MFKLGRLPATLVRGTGGVEFSECEEGWARRAGGGAAPRRCAVPLRLAARPSLAPASHRQLGAVGGWPERRIGRRSSAGSHGSHPDGALAGGDGRTPLLRTFASTHVLHTFATAHVCYGTRLLPPSWRAQSVRLSARRGVRHACSLTEATGCCFIWARHMYRATVESAACAGERDCTRRLHGSAHRCENSRGAA